MRSYRRGKVDEGRGSIGLAEKNTRRHIGRGETSARRGTLCRVEKYRSQTGQILAGLYRRFEEKEKINLPDLFWLARRWFHPEPPEDVDMNSEIRALRRAEGEGV